MEELKSIINTASLHQLRILDICIKERKEEILKSGVGPIDLYKSVSVSRIRGKDFLYLHQRINGKKVSKVIREIEVSDFDFEGVKVSPKAKILLAEKYEIYL